MPRETESSNYAFTYFILREIMSTHDQPVSASKLVPLSQTENPFFSLEGDQNFPASPVHMYGGLIKKVPFDGKRDYTIKKRDIILVKKSNLIIPETDLQKFQPSILQKG